MMFTAAEIEAARISLTVAAGGAVIALLLGAPLAYLAARSTALGAGVAEAMTSLPLVLPPLVLGLALLSILGPTAPVGRFFSQAFGIELAFSRAGAMLAAGVTAAPLAARLLRAAFAAADPALLDAARSLGAKPLDRFLSLTLPLAAPGIIAAACAAFAAALGAFGAVIAFAADIPGETRTLPIAIYSALQRPGGEAEAWRLAALSIALALLAVAAGELAVRRFRVKP